MSRVLSKRNLARRKPVAPISRKRLPMARRSSYMEPSAETLASLKEDSAKLSIYHTPEEFFKALEEDSSK